MASALAGCVAVCSWHFNHGAGGPGFTYGAIDLPKALAVLRKIGKYIMGTLAAASSHMEPVG